jgi:hypothetical protein
MELLLYPFIEFEVLLVYSLFTNQSLVSKADKFWEGPIEFLPSNAAKTNAKFSTFALKVHQQWGFVSNFKKPVLINERDSEQGYVSKIVDESGNGLGYFLYLK